jgi:hypothetical protein
METLPRYHKKTFDKIIHDAQERILKQIRERQLEEYETIQEYFNKKSRMEMGGDKSIHFPKHSTDVSVYRHDPPLQIDPNL